MIGESSIVQTGITTTTTSRSSEEIDQAKKKRESNSLAQATQEEIKDQPQEELIDKIKAITDDGAYSVQFENQQEINQLVVKIFDNETDEIVKQFPAEELLGSKLKIAEFRGNFINTSK